jgi:hypothetical protein
MSPKRKLEVTKVLETKRLQEITNLFVVKAFITIATLLLVSSAPFHQSLFRVTILEITPFLCNDLTSEVSNNNKHKKNTHDQITPIPYHTYMKNPWSTTCNFMFIWDKCGMYNAKHIYGQPQAFIV